MEFENGEIWLFEIERKLFKNKLYPTIEKGSDGYHHHILDHRSLIINRKARRKALKEEIYTLLKLVKINADFNNLVFILCLDPEHVARAIFSRYGNDVKSGKVFLEKIINIPIELPLIEKVDLDLFIKTKLELILKTKKVEKVKVEELFSSINGTFFNSPREVLRVLNSFAITFYAIGDEVNLHDLFWIEFLKMKYSEIYMRIKKFGYDFRSKQIFKDIITFNDTFGEDNTESGLRKELKDLDSNAFRIIDNLFPMVKVNTISAFQSKPLKSSNVLSSELRINHVDHFEKYFSFHTKGKISEVKYRQFKSLLFDDDNDKSEKVLKEILSSIDERIVVYRLIGDVEEEAASDKFKKLIKFLVKRLFLFDGETHKLHSNELLQCFAKKLKIKFDDNRELIFYICNAIEYNQLCWFLTSLTDRVEISFQSELENILIEKIEETDPLSDPFYINKGVTFMIINIWNEKKPENLKKYLEDSLVSEGNINLFIMCFPTIWNDNIVGVFQLNHYKFITEDLGLDSDFIYSKIIEFYPDLEGENQESLSKIKFDDYSDNTAKDNVKQFLFWYFKNNSND